MELLLPVQHAHIQPIYDFRGHLGMGCPAGTLLGLSKAANMGFVWASGFGLPEWAPAWCRLSAHMGFCCAGGYEETHCLQ